MRFSLQDVKKQVHRRGGELAVKLHFLPPGDQEPEIARLIAYHESLLNQAKRQFSQDEARACIGDYRLADCLIATLSAWYQWRSREWSETLSSLADGGARSLPALSAAEIVSPITLRLALFTEVNAHYQGFLAASERPVALAAFAEPLGLEVPELEMLLALDNDEQARLIRATAEPPTPSEVAALYNQWVFEAALSNASQVHFVIDCAAFRTVKPGSSATSGRTLPGTGVGAVIKRLCYLARRLGVYYDLAYEGSYSTLAPRLRLTLYGPQELTGLPQQYGLRLARLCRLLLGYGLRGAKSGASATLSGALVETEATIHFLQRAYSFSLDARLLAWLAPLATAPQTQQVASDQLFDSGIERQFAEAFGALESSQAVEGWHLEREPEPLLLAESIFIPDFALTRDTRRIYVEILGFWTPAYRERKIQKLRQLQARDDLLLAIPEEARAAFTELGTHFPLVWYKGQLSATELLALLRTRYDDFAERLARLEPTQVRAQVHEVQLIPERACYALLHCYRRSELQQAAERIVDPEVLFRPGLGLYLGAWLEHLQQSFVEWVAAWSETRAAGRSLAEALHELRERWPLLATCDDGVLEGLLSQVPGVQVRRSSIFDAVIEYMDTASTDRPEDTADQQPVEVARKRVVRERRVRLPHATKPQPDSETAQGDLWS